MPNNWKERARDRLELLYLNGVTTKVFWECDAVIRRVISDVSKQHTVFIFSDQAVHKERLYILSNTL